MKLILAEPFKTLWAGRDAFAEVEKLQGQVFRELAARRTLRTEVDGRPYFVKIHRGIGWAEIFKNLITAKLPVLGAGLEWDAIHRLQAIGVPTMTGVAFGEKGSNPADQHSFIITEELAPTLSLEDVTLNWVAEPPAPALRHALTAELARMVGGEKVSETARRHAGELLRGARVWPSATFWARTSSFVTIVTIAAAMSSTSSGSTYSGTSPPISGRQVVLPAMTAVPHCIASTSGMPKPS